MWRRASTLPALLLVSVAATGWLYLVRAALPGPHVPEALPLDELAKHAGVPLAWYLAVWGVAALLLGLHARWARIEPLTGALSLAAAVGIWTYLANGISIAVTRQISVRDALDIAARLESTYLGPVLVALAVALLASVTAAPFGVRRFSSRHSWPQEHRSTSCTRCCRATIPACSRT